jgi:hypothetical protein
MSVWASIGGGICVAATAVGLVITFLIWRKQGAGRGMRAAAWSLLPLAAYLTGAIKMIWKMGVAVGDFAKGFVFSAEVWAGIAVAGLAVVLFVASGPLRRRAKAEGQGQGQGQRSGDGRAVGARAGTAGAGPGSPGREISTRTSPVSPVNPAAPVGPATAAAPAPAKARKGKAAADDDDLADVEDILRRHGIT